MTTARIARALCADSAAECSYAIIPPWAEGDDSAIVTAWHDVQALRRQWAQLIEMWPHKKPKFDEELDDKIMELARGLYDDLYDLSA